jgi:hypothetical protein
MNIFYLHDNPKVSAMAMTNKHVVKMIVESAQLLSTAHHILDGPDAISGIYKKTHANHPSAVWVRESIGNYMWLRNHLYFLLNEYAERYNKKPEDHATHKTMLQLITLPKRIPSKMIKTPIRLAITNTAYHVQGDAIASYRKYYEAEKLRLDADIIRYKQVLDKYK